MPNNAIHKSKDKKRKGGAGAEYEYARRLQSLDESEDVPIGRITKMLRADRFLVTYYDSVKRQTLEVQTGVVDRNIQRLKPTVGQYVVPVESGKDKYEIYLVLNDEDARRRSKRIHSSILNLSSTGSAEFDDLGIEFGSEDEPEVETTETTEEKKNKRDKASKHVERVVRTEADASGDEDVDVDAI